MSAALTTAASGAVKGQPEITGPVDWNGRPLEIPDHVPGALWKPNFPTADQVDQAAAYLPGLNRAMRRAEPTTLSSRSGLRDQEIELGQVLNSVDLYEGPRSYLTISPGKVKIWTRDEARRDRTENRQSDAETMLVDAMATFLGEDGHFPGEDENGQRLTPVRGSISEWSRKSQTRMRERLLDLDYTPWMTNLDRQLAMITVTYPGCWMRVAPDSATVMGHLETLRKRYQRAFGEDLLAIWKKEFQGRSEYVWRNGKLLDNWCRCPWCTDHAELEDGRAPHVHMLMQPPTRYRDGSAARFNQWLSETWVAIVDHPDPEQRQRHLSAGTNVEYADANTEGKNYVDSARTADYFAKHSGGPHGKKRYQHKVPAAWDSRPGRFWGYWGLQRKTATVEVTDADRIAAGRLVRRYSKAQGITHRVMKPRTPLGAPISKYPEVVGLAGAHFLLQRSKKKYRGVRQRAVRCKNGRGWLSLNSGPAFAWDLGYALRQVQDHRETDSVHAELQRCGLWDTPLARARRLAPGPRRDALIARLHARETPRAERPPSTDQAGPARVQMARRTEPATCSVCGDRLADVLIPAGKHIGNCLDIDHSEVPASLHARQLEMQ